MRSNVIRCMVNVLHNISISSMYYDVGYDIAISINWYGMDLCIQMLIILIMAMAVIMEKNKRVMNAQ